MRILVTGVAAPMGAAIARTLASSGHTVRAFGVEPGDNPFTDSPRIEPFAGDAALGGSLEPVAAQCQAIVHVAALADKASPRTVTEAARYARYAAERELVDHFIVVVPAAAPRRIAQALAQAEELAKAARVPHTILAAETPEAAASQVSKLLAAVEATA